MAIRKLPQKAAARAPTMEQQRAFAREQRFKNMRAGIYANLMGAEHVRGGTRTTALAVSMAKQADWLAVVATGEFRALDEKRSW